MRASLRLSATAAAAALCATQASALVIDGTFTAQTLAQQLFLDQPGLKITGATLTHGVQFDGDGNEIGGLFPSDFQSGLYINTGGTYGLPSPGIVLSSGFVRNYGAGFNTSGGFSTGDGLSASAGQNEVLGQITGQSSHFDPVQLDITFDADTSVSDVSFIAVFGSEEFPEFVGSSFIDGFGLFLNGQNIASVRQTGTDDFFPVNINHPDFQAVGGTELDGVIAPNDVPLLRFDAPVTPGSTGNVFSIIIADASDSALDTVVYLSSFGDFTGNEGGSEFTPLLPSNQDPDTGTFVFDLVAPVEDVTFFIDPPVAVGYDYAITGAEFTSITAPSQLTVNDPDGYTITIGSLTFTILPGQTLVLPEDVFAFTLSGISELLLLDPLNTLAFPLGVSIDEISGPVSISQTPIIVDVVAVPLPASLLLYGPLLLGLGWVARRRAA